MILFQTKFLSISKNYNISEIINKSHLIYYYIDVLIYIMVSRNPVAELNITLRK